MTTKTTQTPDGKATATHTTFSRETTVSITIKAGPEIIWALLTHAPDYVRWNSTIVSVEGEISPGEKIALKSTADPSRTFKLKVTDYEPVIKMVWASGTAPFFSGVRTYQLTPVPDKATTFTMTEKLGGVMFPMAAKHIPDFVPSFEQFAADLKKEAEAIQRGKS